MPTEDDPYIASLKAEIETLRSERNQWQAKWTIAETEKVNHRNEAERLKNENSELAAALACREEDEVVRWRDDE